MTVTVAVPVKAFGAAKARLHPALAAPLRAELGAAVAARTVWAARAAGGNVVVVTGDEHVAGWATRLGTRVLDDGGGGLNDAAAAAVAGAAGEAWVVIHADLPLVTPEDVAAVLDALSNTGRVLAPTHDGGTSVVGGRGVFDFSYGPGSFHRHLRDSSGAAIVTRPGLAHDLDTPEDLAVVRAAGASRWIDPILDDGPSRVAVIEAEGTTWRTIRDLRLRALADAPDAFRSTHDEEAEAPPDAWRSFVARMALSREHTQLVALVDGTPAGTAMMSADGGVARVGGMWVEPAARGLGAGRALLDRALDWARDRGASRARLAVSHGNAAAEGLYRRAGFEPTGETEPLREGSTVTVVWMERTL